MGYDIHAFIETSGDADPFSESVSCYAQVYLNRDTLFFSSIAPVRDFKPLYELRGIPLRLSWEAEDSIKVLVIDDENEPKCKGEEYFLRSEVESWIEQGASRYFTNHLGEVSEHFAVDRDVLHPSWLTRSELLQSFEFAGISLDYNWDVEVMLDLMKKLEQQMGIGRVRLFYWFDA